MKQFIPPEYMTLLECMARDYWWIAMLAFLSVILIVLHVDVAIQAWVEHRKLCNTEHHEIVHFIVAKALTYLLCAFCGFGVDILGIWWPMMRVKVVLMAPLVVIMIHYDFMARRRKYIPKIIQFHSEIDNLKRAEPNE